MIETKEITKIHDKMLKILKDAQIKKIDIDYNTYGEFLFIVFLFENKL